MARPAIPSESSRGCLRPEPSHPDFVLLIPLLALLATAEHPRTHDVERVAHPVPLIVRQNPAHVDEHRELAGEESAAGIVEPLGHFLDRGAVELALIQIASEL